MGKSSSLLLACLVAISACIALASIGNAQQPQGDPSFQTEQRKMLGAFIDVPSADTTPVEFSVGNVRYRVPRNYIVNMDDYKGGQQTLVAFRVSFPGFKPFTAETKDCFTLAPLYRPQGCVPINFNIIAETPVSDDEGFNNIKHLFLSQTPKQGSSGFEWYEEGDADARLDVYRKETKHHTLVINCFDHDVNRPLLWTCNTSSRLPNGNALQYILSGARYEFNGKQLQYAEQIDDGIRLLIESFTIKGEQP